MNEANVKQFKQSHLEIPKATRQSSKYEDPCRHTGTNLQELYYWWCGQGNGKLCQVAFMKNTRENHNSQGSE